MIVDKVTENKILILMSILIFCFEPPDHLFGTYPKFSVRFDAGVHIRR